MKTTTKIALTIGSVIVLGGIGFLTYKIVKKRGKNNNEEDSNETKSSENDGSSLGNQASSNSYNKPTANSYNKPTETINTQSSSSYGTCRTNNNTSSLTVPASRNGIKAFQFYANKNGASLSIDGRWGKCSQTEWNRLEGKLIGLLKKTGLNKTNWNSVGYKIADRYL